MEKERKYQKKVGKEVEGEKKRGMKEGKQNQSLGFKCKENKLKEKKAKRN